MKFSIAEPSVVLHFFIETGMELQKAIKESRQRKLVPDDKFDRHFKRARVNDMNSRKVIFREQTEDGIERRDKRCNIPFSLY